MRRVLGGLFFSYIRWIMAAFIAASLLMCSISFPVFASEGESNKSNIAWSIDGNTLNISGNGMMSNYTEGTMAPWYEDRESIVTVKISDGISSIGDLAFYDCASLESIVLPESVTVIGEMAFAGCTNLQTISLSSGLKSIGANAFSRCESLQNIRLPDGLLNIDYQAFYGCSSMTSIRVPSTVSNMGSSVFAYCTNLIQAVLENEMSELPRWTFYGCESLVNVSLPSSTQSMGEYAFKGCDSLQNAYVNGSEAEQEDLSNQIQTDLPEFSGVKEGDADSIGSSSVSSSTTGNSGETINTNKEVVDTDNSTVNVTVQTTTPQNPSSSNKTEVDITIDATIENEAGWQEVVDKINDYASYPERFEDETTKVNKIQVNVQIKGDIAVPSDVLSGLAGNKVSLNITNKDGTNWSVDMERMEADGLSKAYDLKYTMTQIEELSQEQKDLVGNVMSFLLEFDQDVPFKITVKIPLGHSYAGHCATISQKSILKDWEVVQSVVIDYSGDAYFYLDSVDKHTKYMVSIDAEGVDVSNALIPETMADQYGGLTDEFGNKYVITGTKSSLGVTFKQFTFIVIGIIVGAAIIIGVIALVLSKFKAQKERMKWMLEDGVPLSDLNKKKFHKKANKRSGKKVKPKKKTKE